MAWIEKRKRKQGYAVRWREAGGRDGVTRTRYAPTREAAKLLKATVEKELLEGSYASADRRAEPFVDYLENVYAGDLTIRDVTRVNYDGVIQKHLRPRLGKLAVGELTAPAMRKLFAGIDRDHGPWVTQMAHRMVRRAVRQAMSEGLLTRDPLAGVRVATPQRREPRILTPAEVMALADAIDDRYASMVDLAAWGGLRIGEIGALRRQDVDVERRTVTISHAVSTPHGRAEIGPPKSAASARTVTLPEWVMKRLAAHMLAHSGDVYVFETPGRLLVTHTNFGPVWRRAVKASGITPPPRFHDLRHTSVAILIEQGAHPKLIQARVGHSSITMTMDTYGHLFPTADAQLAAGLEGFRPEGDVGEVVSL